MRNIFLETKCGGKLFPETFLKKSKVSISMNQLSKNFVKFVFIGCQVEDYQNKLNLSYRPLAFTSYKAFLKKRKEVWS